MLKTPLKPGQRCHAGAMDPYEVAPCLNPPTVSLYEERNITGSCGFNRVLLPRWFQMSTSSNGSLSDDRAASAPLPSTTATFERVWFPRVQDSWGEVAHIGSLRSSPVPNDAARLRALNKRILNWFRGIHAAQVP